MSFFDFNQSEILPYSKSKAAKRDARIQENLKNLNESLKNEKEINLYKEQVQADLAKEQSAKNLINNRSLMRRKRLQEDVKLEKNLTVKTLSKYLAEMVISGLVFDEEFVAKQKGLSSNLTTYIENMFNEGVISEDSFIKNGNLLMEDAYYELTGLVKQKIKNRDSIDIFSESVVDEILSEAKKSKDLSDEIADTVKGKVEDTIKEEKKISKKKEQEKDEDEEMHKEISDAADSLDDDSDIDDTNKEDVSDDEDEMSDDELDALDKETEDDDTDGDGIGDTDEMSDEELTDDDGLDEENPDENVEDSLDDAASDTMGEEPAAEEPEVEAEAQTATDNTMKITIETDGKNVSVNANQSESTEFLNIFGSSRYKERNSKSLFRNLLEGNVAYQAGLLTESTNETGLKMDLILAETITEYTLLETMFTSKIFNLTNSQLKSILKTINFNRK